VQSGESCQQEGSKESLIQKPRPLEPPATLEGQCAPIHRYEEIYLAWSSAVMLVEVSIGGVEISSKGALGGGSAACTQAAASSQEEGHARHRLEVKLQNWFKFCPINVLKMSAPWNAAPVVRPVAAKCAPATPPISPPPKGGWSWFSPAFSPAYPPERGLCGLELIIIIMVKGRLAMQVPSNRVVLHSCGIQALYVYR